MEKVQTKSLVCKTWKTKTVAAILAVIGAVAIPQLFHYIGMITNVGSNFGATFLPMHFTIFLVGYFAGAWAGLASGLASPAISFMLTLALGRPMPSLASLPFMIIELGIYGLATGIFSQYFHSRKLPTIATLLIAQIAGRAVRALAIVIGVFVFSASINVSTIWVSIYQGLPGLILQWIIVPLLVYYVERKAEGE
ncbi:MAG: ECF transporter S component [Clostridia bacterium]|nr:ECF transporter S component [Clostridia bacterium]